MRKRLDIAVRVKRVPLTRAGAQVLKRLASYDFIAFSSKHAQKFFMQLLRERKIALPRNAQVLRVGPRAELLAYHVASKRMVYPRSALAPFDIIKRLRARGATVVPLVIYTALSVPIKPQERRLLARGEVGSLSFKSPSGVRGLLSQLSVKERRIARALPSFCIGSTTAAAARAAGFSKVIIKRL